MPYAQASGLPGPQTARQQNYNSVRLNDKGANYLPMGRIITAASSRDPLNTGYLTTLRPGLLMGKITATGQYAPSIIGLTTADYTSGGTSLTVSPATAVEIVRRLGASGTAKITTAPTATGTVVDQATLTYSAVNVTTGVLTITNYAADIVTGAVIGGIDGSSAPLCIIDDGDGIKVTDIDGNNVDQQFPFALIGGNLNTAGIINYPAAALTTTVTWLKQKLNSASSEGFTFNDAF